MERNTKKAIWTEDDFDKLCKEIGENDVKITKELVKEACDKLREVKRI